MTIFSKQFEANFKSLISFYDQKENTNIIVERYKEYLKDDVHIFYQNLINGKLLDFDPNTIDSVLSKYIINKTFGLSSNEYKILTNFFVGTYYDVNWVGSGMHFFNYRRTKFIHPRIIMGHQISEKYDPNCYKIPNKCRIGMMSDWGIGNDSAYDLANKLALFNPDYVIHLGDVYYSGTKQEFKDNFLKPLQVLDPKTKIFNIPGNHDYYSGSEGLHYCLKKIGQNASFISLYNDFIQIEGLDTGFNDSNVFQTLGIVKENTKLVKTEAEWHVNRCLNMDPNKKLVILSHHPPITLTETMYFDTTDKERPTITVNPELLDQVKPYVNKADLWLCGHSHAFNVYKPYIFEDITIKRCRLIGNGACESNSHPDEIINSINPANFKSNKYPIPESEGIFPNSFLGDINNSFVIFDIDNGIIKVTYYQIPQIKIGEFGEAQILYEEYI